jgi:gluconokinase
MPPGRAQFLILSIDIGSSSTRSALFDDHARRFPGSDASVPYSISYTADGGAELAPRTLYRAARRAISESLQAHDRTPSRRRLPIRAIATSAFWQGLLGVDRQWRPVTPIYTWADARAADDARDLRAKLSQRAVHSRTGCMLHASFWPAKLMWLRRTRPQSFRRTALWVSPVDWIYHELFGTTVSSASMASATGLYNLSRSAWDEKLCAACHVDSKQLLQLGQLVEPAHLPPALHGPVDVFAAIGDGAAGNLGSGADQEGAIAINVGTSAAVRVIQSTREAKATKVPLGLFRYVVDEHRSIMGGAVSNAGNLRQWALRELRLNNDPISNRQVFARTLAARDRLTALPFWAGERAPTWPDCQHGVIDGLTHSTTAIELLRALTSSVFYRLADILDLITAAGVKPRRIIVSGGILRSIPEVRLLADAMARDVEVAGDREASLRGAAVYALQQLGVKVPALRPGSRIKHNRKLTSGHLLRRQRQHALEKALTKADLSGGDGAAPSRKR